MASLLSATAAVLIRNGQAYLHLRRRRQHPVSFDGRNLTIVTSRSPTQMADHDITQAPYERRFSPYEFNGGTTLAISGPDYAVVAPDTRLSSGYSIVSRNVLKVHPLTDQCVLSSVESKTDVDQLRSSLDIKLKVYSHNQHRIELTEFCQGWHRRTQRQ